MIISKLIDFAIPRNHLSSALSNLILCSYTHYYWHNFSRYIVSYPNNK